MKSLLIGFVLLAAAVPVTAAPPENGVQQDLRVWLDSVSVGLARVDALHASGRSGEATAAALRAYLDYVESIEAFYGAGGRYGTPSLREAVTDLEATFHELMQAGDAESARAHVREATTLVARVRATAERDDVVMRPVADQASLAPVIAMGSARTAEIQALLKDFDAASAAYASGDAKAALSKVETAYLQGIEPLEPRLPAERVNKLESLIHLQLRPMLARDAEPERIDASFTVLRAELLAADALLANGSTYWFGTVNAFAIIVREGLEAVLLIAAIVAYLRAMNAGAQHERRLWAGVGLGVAASFGTWFAAQWLLPVTGASRELIEGLTALIAVAVLLYVSNWLFQKTYIHDWKAYLRERVGRAVTTGSSLAMAGLAFAAVYREGFETVLFYQALLLDSGPGPVLSGFIPGTVLILAVGAAILKLGVKLPLKQVFAATNAILIYLALVFTGKGIYALQEAGIFAAHPLTWLPDSGALKQFLGFHPLAETMVAQLAFGTLVFATYLYYRMRRRPIPA